MNLFDSLLSYIAPHVCADCGALGEVLCVSCQSGLKPSLEQCYRCGQPSPTGATCATCLLAMPLMRVVTATPYEGVAKQLVAQLKFERARAAAEVMSSAMIARPSISSLLCHAAVIVPVPTASNRVRRRGYDQSVLIARDLAKRTGCRYLPLLERCGRTQQRGAARHIRFQQAESAFRLRMIPPAPARPFVLVDDVVTTGATLEAAARLLRLGGAGTVAGIAFARA